MRLFGDTPLDDTSGQLVETAELSYHEADFVASELVRIGLGQVLNLAGIDLYSLADLQRLGVVSWKNIPPFGNVIAREICPVLRAETERLREEIPGADPVEILKQAIRVLQ